MPLPIRDYAMIGDLHTGALVGLDGSIDWLCLPQFDSPSTFAGLLGGDEHGMWRLRPVGADRASGRAYEDGGLILRTRWTTATGEVEVTELMPVGDRQADLIRRVHGVRGTVEMEQEVRFRFGYADALPWVRQVPDPGGSEEESTTLLAIAGPDAVVLRGPHLSPADRRHRGRFTVRAGEDVDLTLTWYPSHRHVPDSVPVDRRIAATRRWWTDWAATMSTGGRYGEAVRRSLVLLRALTHEDTGGIVAALTTSLPEQPGGERNWDYRYVWLRDASLTIMALLAQGHVAEAGEWRGWLLRAIAGDPADVQIMYALDGARRLPEWTVDSLPGYHSAAPVRVGNGAALQYQGDVFGEVMIALDEARAAGVTEDRFSWSLQVALLEFVEKSLDRRDNGIWEIRGEPRYFTQSRVQLWAAFDRGIRAVREHGLDGPITRWEAARERLRREIEAEGFDAERGSYRQAYGSSEVDASLLTLPTTGYLAADDPRMLGTVARIESELMTAGLVRRYRTESGVDGLNGGESPFLACSFWLVTQYAASGRVDDAEALMDRLVGFANDVGMLAEEVDPTTGEHLGNTPQAFSHLALTQAAAAISAARGEPVRPAPGPDRHDRQPL
ncbi:MAG: glycoside hydrolase family 15 protein [Micrococcales bacterium]|nr:glycoside hydrolase family 15 protein [Micrococcales bacterium]